MRRNHNGRPTQCLRSDRTPKSAFPSLRQAQSQLKRLEKMWRTGEPLRCYLCSVCHRWHVGKPGRRKNTGGWT